MSTEIQTNSCEQLDSWIPSEWYTTEKDKPTVLHCIPEEFKLDEATEQTKQKYYDDNLDVKQEVLDIIIEVCGSQLKGLGSGIGLIISIYLASSVTDIEAVYQQIARSLLDKLNIKAERNEFEIDNSPSVYTFE